MHPTPPLPPLRITGCLLGSALGDALCAPYEGGWAERALWRVLGRTRQGLMRYTDDTVMTIALASSLLECGNFQAADAAQRFAHSYHWHRGYGPGAAKVLRAIRKGTPWQQARFAAYAQGSWGNGGAMRAHVAALWVAAGDAAACTALARAQAALTHAHPLAQDGAALIAAAARSALALDAINFGSTSWWQSVIHDANLQEPQAWQPRLAQALAWLQAGATPAPDEVAATLSNGISALNSCVTALYVAARFVPQDFASLIHFVQRMGGDTDTIAAMAGGIYGAARGLEALPCSALAQLEDAKLLHSLAWRLTERLSSPSAHASQCSCPRASGSALAWSRPMA